MYQYNIVSGISSLPLPVKKVQYNTATNRDWWLMRSANWKMAMLYKVKCPINSLSLCPVWGWHSNLSLSIHCSVWAGVLWAVEQWGCNPISVGSLGWPACERGGRERHRPGACWQRPHSHTHWTTNWPTQTDSDEERSGWFSDPDVWAGHNGTVCFTNPVLSVISQFYFPTALQVQSHWRR